MDPRRTYATGDTVQKHHQVSTWSQSNDMCRLMFCRARISHLFDDAGPTQVGFHALLHHVLREIWPSQSSLGEKGANTKAYHTLIKSRGSASNAVTDSQSALRQMVVEESTSFSKCAQNMIINPNRDVRHVYTLRDLHILEHQHNAFSSLRLVSKQCRNSVETGS